MSQDQEEQGGRAEGGVDPDRNGEECLQAPLSWSMITVNRGGWPRGSGAT